MNSSTSDQHRDLRTESVCLSQKHIKLFTDYFAAHPTHLTVTVSSTSFEVGKAAAAKLVEVPPTDIKMKRGDRVNNMVARA